MAERRLGALQLAAVLGNVSEACRRLGIDRASYYDWQRRFRAGGMEGLRPAWHGARRRTRTTAKRAESLQHAALAHPGWGCARLARALAGEGVHLSPPAVQNALRRIGIPLRRDRALRLEQMARQGKVVLSREQIAFVERFEPGFRECALSACRQGERVLQGVVFLGIVERRRAYIHCVLDAFSSFAFARLAGGRRRAAVAGSLLEDCVWELRGRGLSPRRVFTPDSPSFRGTRESPYGRALRRCRLGQARTPALPGQVERFRRYVVGELLHGEGHLHLGESWDALRERLAACIERYNSRPLEGHPNYGAAPRRRLYAHR